MSFFAKHVLSYTPVINAKRGTIATRIMARGTQDEPCEPAEAYVAIRENWTDDLGVALLDLGDYGVDGQLLDVTPSKGMLLEVPARLIESSEGQEWIKELQERNFSMVLQGMPTQTVPDAVIDACSLAVVDVKQDEWATNPSAPAPESIIKRRADTVISGVNSIAQMTSCFATGVEAITGWPFEDAMNRESAGSRASSFVNISRLIMLIDSGADSEAMEKVLAVDPALAYRLFRYLNSPAFGLTTEIRSFDHAMMMLGQNRLRKWLALLLTTASEEQDMKPLMYASVRRGFLLEQLVSEDGDQQTRDEAFILGIFSMLDKLFGEPFEQLFERLQMPELVHDALVNNTGTAIPYLDVARAMEGPPSGIGPAQNMVFLSAKQCNFALFKAFSEATLAQDASAQS